MSGNSCVFFAHVEGGVEKNNAFTNVENMFKNIEHVRFVYLGISIHTYIHTHMTTAATTIEEQKVMNLKESKAWGYTGRAWRGKGR